MRQEVDSYHTTD